MPDQPTAGERFLRGIIPENPTFRQLLGLCPTLAVTNSMAGAITMGVATGVVMVCSNVLVSLIRGFLQPHLRILVFTLTIATFVTMVHRLLAAYMYDMSKTLGPYIPLIIVNCVIISRAEICASKQSPAIAAADGVGMGLGITLGLSAIAVVREILGTGGLFGFTLLPGWPGWTIMILPPGAFFTLGLLLGVVNWYSERRSLAKKGSE